MNAHSAVIIQPKVRESSDITSHEVTRERMSVTEDAEEVCDADVEKHHFQQSSQT